MMGFGFGSLWLGPVCAMLMKNLGWRAVFVILGVVFSALVLAGSRVIKAPPAPLEPAPKPSGTKERGSLERRQYTPSEMLKTPSFWQMFLWSTVIGGGSMAVIGHAAAIARSLGASVGLAAFAGGCYSVGSGVGRVVYGAVFDRLGMKKTTRISGSLYLLATLFLCGSQQLVSVPMLYVGMAMIGFSGGATPPVCAAFCSSAFGLRHFPVNLSLISMNLIPASFLGPLVAGMMTASTGNYMSTFVMTFLLGCVGLTLTQMIREK
jgi:OFA family oxalate/formate antiporter-like MFS transporter